MQPFWKSEITPRLNVCYFLNTDSLSQSRFVKLEFMNMEPWNSYFSKASGYFYCTASWGSMAFSSVWRLFPKPGCLQNILLLLLCSSSHSLSTPGSPGGSLWWVTTHLMPPGLVQYCRHSLPLSQGQTGYAPLCGQLEKDGGVEPLKWLKEFPVVPRSVKNRICSLCSRPG